MWGLSESKFDRITEMKSKSVFNMPRNSVLGLFYYYFIGIWNKKIPVKIKDWKNLSVVITVFFFPLKNLNSKNCIILI